jgi:hypothetical protein
MISLHPYAFVIIAGTTLLTLLLLTFVCIYLYVHRKHNKRETEAVIAQKRLLYSSPASMTSNRFVFPLSKLPNAETNVESPSKINREISSQYVLNEIPPNYKTFDLAKRYRQHLSSDSSYASSNPRRSQPLSFPFDTVKSKFQQVHSTSSYPLENMNSEQISSDSDDLDNELFAPSTPKFEYSLVELFRIELVYKLYYSINDNQLLFQIVRITPMQSLIEQCFPSLICKIRLFTNTEKQKNKKYFSKKDPINELFKFDLDQFNLEKVIIKMISG